MIAARSEARGLVTCPEACPLEGTSFAGLGTERSCTWGPQLCYHLLQSAQTLAFFVKNGPKKKNLAEAGARQEGTPSSPSASPASSLLPFPARRPPISCLPLLS